MRLYVQGIEAKPKRVRLEGMTFNMALTESQKRSIEAIRQCIINGTPIPRRYYRSTWGDDKDELLKETGYIHLHLDSPRSNVLLFLIQYDEWVTFLGVRGHYDFNVKPVGKVITGLFGKRAADIEADEIQRKVDAAQAVAAKNSSLKKGLLPKRSRSGQPPESQKPTEEN